MLTVGESRSYGSVTPPPPAATSTAPTRWSSPRGGGWSPSGFVDAHVHLAQTGSALQTLDLSQTLTLAAALGELASYASGRDGAVLLAHGWDESRWPEARPFTGAELDRAVGHRVAYVSRVDGHSAVVSSALLDLDPAITGLAGWRGDGVVDRDAHHASRAAVAARWTGADRSAAVLAALRRAAEVGITSVHEVNAPHISPYDDVDIVAALRAHHPLPEVVLYWGALMGGDHPDASCLAGFAGDLCVDGALGSRTAALNAPYADADTAGHLYLDAEQVAEHVVWCTQRGRQAGVPRHRGQGPRRRGHRVRAGRRAGRRADRLVAARHRLEHVEMPTPEAIAVMREYGVVASVQPAFDSAWGGPGALYEQRLGARRAAPMNPFASMLRSGVTVAFGSDSPVTPLAPWIAVRAAVHHHNPDERIGVRAALTAHTRGGHQARGDDQSGVLAPGSTASYAVWDVEPEQADEPAGPLPSGTGLPVLHPDGRLPACARTVVRGVPVFDVEEPS